MYEKENVRDDKQLFSLVGKLWNSRRWNKDFKFKVLKSVQK